MKPGWRFAVGGLLLASLPTSGHAQEPGAIEIGLIGRQNVYDTEVGIESSLGAGARLGVVVWPDLVIEIEGSYAEPKLSDPPGAEGRRFISHELYQARIVHTHWLGQQLGLLLGGGYAYDHYHRPRNVAARGGGFGGMIGLRYRMSDRFSARFEWTGYLVPEDRDAFPVPRVQALNMGAQMGVSFVLRQPSEAEVVFLPPPPPDTVIVTRTVEAPLPSGRPESLCLATGEAVTVYVSTNGDTLIGERRVPVSSLRPTVAFAGVYASDRNWFVTDQPLAFEQEEYRRAGAEVALSCTTILQVGEREGVPLFADVTAPRPIQTLYVPVRPGLWQGYQAGPGGA